MGTLEITVKNIFEADRVSVYESDKRYDIEITGGKVNLGTILNLADLLYIKKENVTLDFEKNGSCDTCDFYDEKVTKITLEK